MLTALIVWILVGAVAGWLAGYVMTRDTTFSAADVVLGMIGAVVGGWLSNLLLNEDPNGFSVWSIISALVGALLVAFIYRQVTGRSAQ
jgi:uncharacterized membrane protein YeaQ/YmgE (transglycosylase-associated protein family)